MYYDNLRILKLNPCLSNVLVYNNTYMHTHKPPFVCTIFSISEKKKQILDASLKKQHRRCTHTHLLRANTDYSLFLLSKELHIANPRFTNHGTSALLNLVMLSHLTSHANWPRTVSTGKASCQRDNDKDAKKGLPVFALGEKKELIKLHESRTEGNH